MLRTLDLAGLGPASDWQMAFGSRLNVLTGENGLGKTLILEAIWAVLTHSDAGLLGFSAANSPDASSPPGPTVRARLHHRDGPLPETLTSWRFERALQEWTKSAFQVTPGPDADTWFPFDSRQEAAARPRSLVLSASAEGSISVFDAYQAPGTVDTYAQATVRLSAAELLNGKDGVDPDGTRSTVCGGLIKDWVLWQGERSPSFDALRQLIQILSPPGDADTIRIGRPARVRLSDRRDIPTVVLSYGTVPITLAPAGLRRCLGLIYALIWAWNEHTLAAQVLGVPPTRDIVLLVDEPETHLHPAWQRVFLPALLRAVGALAPSASVQLFVATHSPIVLASLESVFSDATDELFHLSREGTIVAANPLEFGKEGDVSNWLASEAFGRVGSRTPEAQLAIDAAMHHMAGRSAEAARSLGLLSLRFDAIPSAPVWRPDPASPLQDQCHSALAATLPSHDRFWPRWLVTAEAAQARP